jgi:hypothetical protein
MKKQTKRTFDGQEENNIIPFGPDNLNDKQYGIMRGRLRLSASDLKRTFDRSVGDTLESCARLFRGQVVKVSVHSSKTSRTYQCP